MKSWAGAVTLGNLASAIAARAEEASVVAELKAGSEDAYAWLIAHFHQPIYSLVYRTLNDPSDAADVTQEVFLKVFRGIRHFHGGASLKTWIYRIAIHEASNQRRWWFRHKSRERSLEPLEPQESHGLEETLADDAPSPFEAMSQQEVRDRVEMELKQVPEPYRTTVILRDIASKGEGASSARVSSRPWLSCGSSGSRERSRLLCRNHQRRWLEASWMAMR